MKLLLDENLPKKLKLDFPEHEIFTVYDKGWNGKKNGELIRLMIEDKFDAFLTFDKNFRFQQNFKKYSIPVLVLNASSNSYLILKALIPNIKIHLKSKLTPGGVEIK